MKKTIAFLFVLGAFALATNAFALTPVSLSPSQLTRSVGQSFDVVVVLNPEKNTPSYSAKIELNYDPAALELTHFTFANSSMQLSQPGYDVVDPSTGRIVKTLGFPGGISSPTIFGTATFRAKRAGPTLIAVSNNSVVLDANNTNIFERGAAGVADIDITGGAVLGASTVKKTTSTRTTVRPTATPYSTATAGNLTTQATTTDNVSLSNNATDTGSSTGSVLGASASNAGQIVRNTSWVGIAVGVLILLLIIGVIYSIARQP